MDYYTIKQSAEILEKKRTFIYDLIASDIVECVTIGVHKYLKKDDIDNLKANGLTFEEREKVRAYRREQAQKHREKNKPILKKAITKLKERISK